MKKFIYLCGVLLLSVNVMAQIDLNDRSWDSVLYECFDEPIPYWEWDANNFSNSNHRWKAFLGNHIDSDSLYHLYQFNNARYDSINGTMRLVAEYDTAGLIPLCQFDLPDNGSSCNNIYLSNKLYFSGAIEYVKNVWFPWRGMFRYGYFEIRCKLPKHKGAFPAFWLHSSSTVQQDPYYEEIDIFEYNWKIGDPNSYHWAFTNPDPTYPGDPYVITTGIYRNLTGNSIDFDTETFARNYPRLPAEADDISGWHTYSCEWMPDHVYWYLDGQLVNSYYNVAHIPSHPMTLKTNYAIDGYCNYGDTTWMGTGEMTIDHIKVYQLKCNCNTEKTITCQSDLNLFDYTVKKSITIAPTNDTIVVGATDKITFRATDFFEITGPFEVQQGGEFTVIRQDCPE